MPLSPVDYYGLTKATADLSIGMLAQRGLKSVRMRPFNHTGPGQSPQYALSSFARQIAMAKVRGVKPTISVGDLSSKRDFLDVRDVVRAYVSVIQNVEKIACGEMFNVSSGRAYEMSHLLKTLIELSGEDVEVRQSDSFHNTADVKLLVGDATKLSRVTNWQPKYRIEETLSDLLDYWASQTVV
jgi:GDP-4-dehydro-6-deoxy-D-mannose reductase